MNITEDQNLPSPPQEVEHETSSPESPRAMEPKIIQVSKDVEGKETSNLPNSSVSSDSTETELSNFSNKINELLAEKENLKLGWVQNKSHIAYYRKWSNEANDCFVLVSQLRKRQKLYSSKKTA